ncbi:MAG: hypothetical protein LBU83_03550, partial [Bacteroidales bacterium]|nr:hypothetical protein [Bacteroidales bacterium]
KLVESWQKLDAEARQTLKMIKERMDKSDDFLRDFNIEAVILEANSTNILFRRQFTTCTTIVVGVFQIF